MNKQPPTIDTFCQPALTVLLINFSFFPSPQTLSSNAGDLKAIFMHFLPSPATSSPVSHISPSGPLIGSLIYRSSSFLLQKKEYIYLLTDLCISFFHLPSSLSSIFYSKTTVMVTNQASMRVTIPNLSLMVAPMACGHISLLLCCQKPRMKLPGTDTLADRWLWSMPLASNHPSHQALTKLA